MWCKLGKVIKPDSATEHWKTQDLEGGGKVILVEVETMPDGCDLTCRLSSGFSSGGGNGAWAIPRVDSIVGVAVPDGEIEFMPIVFGVLDCNAPPDGLDETLSLIVDDRTLAIEVPELHLGGRDASQHPFHGEKLSSDLANVLTKVSADLVAVFAAASAGTPTSTADIATMIGKLQAGNYLSTKVTTI